MRYEVETDATHVEFELLEADEPPQTVYFPLEPGTDARFIRGFAFKPTVEGANMTLAVRVYADSVVRNRRIVGGTLTASARCPGVTIVP